MERPPLINRLVKEGYLAKTGQTTKAQTGPRKGSPTTEYTFGKAVLPEASLLPSRANPPEALTPAEAPKLAEASPPQDSSEPEAALNWDYLMNEPASAGTFPLGFPLQRIVHGSPGSGKSYLLEEDSKQAHHVIRTVFHPESRYSDFVGGLRPELIYKVGAGAGAEKFIGATGEAPGEPYVQYVLQPGPLLKAYHLACLYPHRSIVLLIEELSRANAAHVFGDTLQLLDRMEDGAGPLQGHSVYEIEPRPDVRSWLVLNEVAHDQVGIGNMRFPSNLYLWATMNRSDQNARQLDSAFLRRWSKQYVSYEDPGAYDASPVKYGGAMVGWGTLRKAINERLSVMQGIPEDKLVGPYFLPRSRLANPRDVYEDLFGYVWNDVLKTRATDFFSGAATFAELQRLWNDGNGAPLGPLGGTSPALESEA